MRVALTTTIATLGVGAAAASATAELIAYEFTLTGADGSVAGGSFTDTTVIWSLIANTADIQPGSPSGFNVRPLSGSVLVGDTGSAITEALVANSAVWTYTSDAQGLRIGFGTWEPFESFTSGSYDGPLGWDMTTAFSGGAVGDEDILRAIQSDGIATDAGVLLVTDYATASFSATVVPAPGAVTLLVGTSMVTGRSRRRRRG